MDSGLGVVVNLRERNIKSQEHAMACS